MLCKTRQRRGISGGMGGGTSTTLFFFFIRFKVKLKLILKYVSSNYKPYNSYNDDYHLS